MSTETLTNVLRDSTIWGTLPRPFTQYIQSINAQAFYQYNIQSRKLREVLNATYDAYNIPSYKLLFGMCATLLDSFPIHISKNYKIISSEDAETLTLEDIINETTHYETTHTIHIWHIPKGKSYLRNILDNAPELNRLKQIETFCIENQFHFIRIYRGFGNTAQDDITIFTDTISINLINTITIMLPHLFNIKHLEKSPETPETIEYNKKVDALIEIFTQLYNSVTTPEFKKQDLIIALDKFINLFDLTSSALKEFTQRLTTAINVKTTSHLNNHLKVLEQEIRHLEETLENNYVQRQNTQRALIAQTTLTDMDITTFIETIKNTKAIEILDINSNLLKLKITAPLQYFIESDLTSYENNPTSSYNQYYNNCANSKQLKRILHKIFVTREYKLIAQAIVQLSINNTNYNSSILSIHAQQHDLSNLTEFPNPHLWHFDCWDKAKSEINKAISTGNFEAMLMQMVAAIQTVNIAEHASFINGLVKDFCNNHDIQRFTHIIDSNNNIHTIQELINIEKDLEQKEILEAAKETITTAPKQEYTQVEIPDDDSNWE